jgi:bifunctional DNA-binding transcriptional regulator/antitoxin component of YhaV-PrlF toxin-antitoxin module
MATLETRRMREVVKNLTTVSDKIRALDEAGFERADIARFLDKRYQHVRNVLVAPHPPRKTKNQAAYSPQPESASKAAIIGDRLKARVQIGAGGRVVIPSEMRAIMGVSEGDMLLAQMVDGELRLLSQDAAIRKAQAIVRQYVPEGVSLVDELIADRREEARQEVEQ